MALSLKTNCYRSAAGIALAFLLCLIFLPANAQHSSVMLKSDGRLLYHTDSEENSIPDFSHAGYRGGGVQIPNVPVRIQLSPSGGDDTERIQQALLTVSRRSPDRNGHRGAVLLKPGTYRISETIEIPWDGVVLRGSGDNSDPRRNTILSVARSVRESVIVAGNPDANWFKFINGTLTFVTSPFVPAGARNFEVEDASNFEAGDNIIIRHRSTPEWLESIDGGGTADAEPWEPGRVEIYYNRYITRISGNTLSIDAPVFQHLDTNLSEVRVYTLKKWDMPSEIGIESLRIEIQSNNPSDENHAKNGIILSGIENAWVNNVTVLHFSHIGIGTRNASYVTIQNSQALQPHSRLTGERRYNFNAEHFSNNILFNNVRSMNGRRSFVSNGTSVASGIVFLRSRSEGALGSSEGHQRWSQALLYDNVTFVNPDTPIVLGLYNRGNLGSSHGWGAVHSVAWNVEASGRQIIIQKPPGAQNYSIGSNGEVTSSWLFNHPAGLIESTGITPLPESLYEAQLQERKKFGIRPDTPARLTISNLTENQLRLSWNHSSTYPTEYLIERSEDGGQSFQSIAVQAENDSMYVDRKIGEKTYFYRIRAKNQNGISNYSAVTSGTPRFNADVLPDFSLREPVDQFELNIVNPDSPLNFRWDTVESSLDLTRSWILYNGLEPTGRPAAELLITDQNGLQLTPRQLIEMLGGGNYQIGPSFEASWTVRLKSKTIQKEAQQPKRFRLNTDFISPFALTSPETSNQISLESSLTDTVRFEWEVAESPRDLEYTWLLGLPGDNFSEPLASVNTEENSVTLTLNQLINYLEIAGVVFDRQLDLEWTVIASTSTKKTEAKEPRLLRLTKNEGSSLLNEQKTESELIQNYPNPFNPVTTIRYYLAQKNEVSLDVFDLAGVHVATLESGVRDRGYYQVSFNGSGLSSGVYIYRLKAGSSVFTQKMILIK